MSFSLSGGAPAGDATAEAGPELPEIDTSDVGFLGLDKDCNIQFLPTPWPADALPAPTSSLLTISNSKGLIVGGGPEGLILATTQSVREAIAAKTESGSKTKPFQAQGHIRLPNRPSHVAFCVSESALAVALESQNQLIVYDAANLTSANPQPQITIGTNAALRSVVPNPSSDTNLSSLVALITVTGDLLVADLKAGSLVSGQSGPIFRNGVASVTWSKQGKQMVAGLANGTCVQLDPQGMLKAEIPRPLALKGDKHVSSISWLENDIFLAFYTPMEGEDDAGMIPDSDCYIIERRKQAPFLYRQLPSMCAPFGLKRTPGFHFVARLSNNQSGLKDALIVSSTCSTDLGLVTRVTSPFKEADDTINNIFTTTTVTEDTRRATLPLNAESMDTSTIGLVLDLTSTETVSYDIEKQSKTPLPNLMVLTNEGILVSWWFLYLKAIDAGIPYNTVATAATQKQPSLPATPSTPAPTSSFAKSTQPPFGQTGFGQPAFGATAFGTPQSSSSAFGKPSTPTTSPAFGSTSTLEASQKPTFGAPSALGNATNLATTTPNKSPAPAFGSTGILGQRGSSFGQVGMGLAANSKPTFGQASSLGGKGFGGFASSTAPTGTSPFSKGTTSAGGGGFSSFSGAGGFASVLSSQPSESPFGKAETSGTFAQNTTTTSNSFGVSSQSAYGSPSPSTPFGSTQGIGESKSGFGLAKERFNVGSTFKPDEKSAAENEPRFGKPSKSDSFSLDASLGNLLGGSTAKTSPPTESMDDGEDATSATPHEPSATSFFGKPSSFGLPKSPATSPPKSSGLFGTQSQTGKTPAAVQISRPSTLFGSGASATLSPLSSPSEKTVVPTVSSEKESFEAPLPPDATSRAVYGPGDTSASSNVSKSSYDDAPLPPDFTKTKKVEDAPLPPDFLKKQTKVPEPEEAPLPPDFLTKPKKPQNKHAKDQAVSSAVSSPVKKPETKSTAADLPLPVKEESISLPHDSEGSDGDFEDSGEEITHDISPPNEPVESEFASFKTSPESSFGGSSRKEPTGGLFTKITKPEQQPRAQQTTRPLFGEISQPSLPPPKPRVDPKLPRSPSPVRPGARRGHLRPEQNRSTSAPLVPGSVFGAFQPTSTKPPPSRFEAPLSQNDLIEEDESKAAQAESKRLASEVQHLSSDDEDSLRRDELSRPLVPAPSLDPFVPRQDYSGEHFKPGVPGQIERLYRDINSMIDTLGLNSRSIASFILHEENTRSLDLSQFQEILLSDTPVNILDLDFSLADIENIDELLNVLAARLEEQRLNNVQKKLDECHRFLTQDVFNLRDQCAHIQKTLDAYTDLDSIRIQPLSAEQAGLQQDLRKASTSIQSQLSELEQGISLLRAKIADSSSSNRSISGHPMTKRPTVEAVTSTIATMMNMAERKSTDIDVLEAQVKRLGIDLRTPASREGTPLSTPVRRPGFRVPTTPDSQGGHSTYQTPQSSNRFQSSVNGKAKHSRLRSVNSPFSAAVVQDSDDWKIRTQRRKEAAGNLKRAIGGRKVMVRTMDDE